MYNYLVYFLLAILLSFSSNALADKTILAGGCFGVWSQILRNLGV